MHDSAIDPGVLARVIERRGRRHIAETLDAAACALVVIDLQDGFMLPGVPLEVAAARAIVPNVNRLAAAVRAAGGRVVWVRMNVEGERDSWSTFFRRFPAEIAERQLVALAPGGAGYPLYAELDVHSGDDVIDKKRYSAFIAGSSSPVSARSNLPGIWYDVLAEACQRAVGVHSRPRSAPVTGRRP